MPNRSLRASGPGALSINSSTGRRRASRTINPAGEETNVYGEAMGTREFTRCAIARATRGKKAFHPAALANAIPITTSTPHPPPGIPNAMHTQCHIARSMSAPPLRRQFRLGANAIGIGKEIGIRGVPDRGGERWHAVYRHLLECAASTLASGKDSADVKLQYKYA